METRSTIVVQVNGKLRLRIEVPAGISEADVERLQAYPWPGNVRELMHTIERAAVLSDGPRLVIPPLGPCSVASSTADEGTELTTLAEMERRHLRRVLEHTGGRVSGAGGAAEIIALKPSTLNFRIRKPGSPTC